MKTLEWLFLSLFRPQLRHAQETLQFAYQTETGVKDAILDLLLQTHLHLGEGSGSVRILFLAFSSVFNTIQTLYAIGQNSWKGVMVVGKGNQVQRLITIINTQYKQNSLSNSIAIYNASIRTPFTTTAVAYVYF